MKLTKRYRDMTDAELVEYALSRRRSCLDYALAVRLKAALANDRAHVKPGRPHIRVSPGTMGGLGMALWRCEWRGSVQIGVSPLDAYLSWQQEELQDERKRIGR